MKNTECLKCKGRGFYLEGRNDYSVYSMLLFAAALLTATVYTALVFLRVIPHIPTGLYAGMSLSVLFFSVGVYVHTNHSRIQLIKCPHPRAPLPNEESSAAD